MAVDRRELVLDTESTGLGEDDRIIEIGIVEHIDHIPTGMTYNWFVNPQREISWEATEVHGISDDFLRDKPTFDRIADDFLAVIGHDTLVMHNASFDLTLINRELEIMGKPPIPEFQVTDTLELARKALPQRSRHTLESLCNYYRINREGRRLHSAMSDAQLLSDVYQQLLREFDSGDMIDRITEISNARTRNLAHTLKRSSEPAPRLSDDDRQRHRDYVKNTLGPDALWYKVWEAQSDKATKDPDHQQ